jgi:hypothetical protein
MKCGQKLSRNWIRTFAFQYYNNSLGVGARIAGRYRNGGIVIDQRCTFCVVSGALVTMREEFCHVFFDCPAMGPVLDRAFGIFFLARQQTVEEKKLLVFTGLMAQSIGKDRFFGVLTSLLINFAIWQYKLKKKIPSIASLSLDIDTLFDQITFASNKIRGWATNNGTPICRRWRDAGGRGGHL